MIQKADKPGMMEEDKYSSCLICVEKCELSSQVDNKTSADNRDEDECIKKHVRAIFLLRNILQLPSTLCYNLLATFTPQNPGDWFDMCSVCSNVLEDALQLHRNIVELEMDMENIRIEVSCCMKNSFLPNHSQRQTKGKGANVNQTMEPGAYRMIRDYFNDPQVKVEKLGPVSRIKKRKLLPLPQPITASRLQHQRQREVASRTERTRSTSSSPATSNVITDIKNEDSFDADVDNDNDPSYFPEDEEDRAETDPEPVRRNDDDSENEGLNPCSSDFRQFATKKKYKRKRQQSKNKVQKVHKAHGPNDPRPKYTCDKCPFVTKKSEQFENHKLRHKHNVHFDTLEDEQIRCKLCGETGHPTKSFTVSRHLLEKHSSELDGSLFICHECGKSYCFRSSLKHHILHAHKNPKRYSCDSCGKGYSTRTDFEDHQVACKNGGKRVIICDICGSSMSSRRALQDHTKKYHSVDSTKSAIVKEGQHQCRHCGISLMHDRALKIHLREVHSQLYDFKCHLCDAIYMKPASLKIHMDSKHSRSKGVCQYCQAEVKCAAYLRRHWKDHCKKYPGDKSIIH